MLVHRPESRVTVRALLATVIMLCLALSAVGCSRKATQVIPTSTSEAVPPAPTRQADAAESTTPVGQDPKHEFDPVFFSYDSSFLDEAARTALDGAARSLRDDPAAQIVIEGHCDERGTAEYNTSLGERRARVARDYLIDAGVSSTRITVISYGKERPFATGSNEEAWAQNRRAHFVQK